MFSEFVMQIIESVVVRGINKEFIVNSQKSEFIVSPRKYSVFIVNSRNRHSGFAKIYGIHIQFGGFILESLLLCAINNGFKVVRGIDKGFILNLRKKVDS